MRREQFIPPGAYQPKETEFPLIELKDMPDLEREYNQLQFVLEILLSEPIMNVDALVESSEPELRKHAQQAMLRSSNRNMLDSRTLRELFHNPSKEWEKNWFSKLKSIVRYDFESLFIKQQTRNKRIKQWIVELGKLAQKYQRAHEVKDTASDETREQAIRKVIERIRNDAEIKPVFDELFSVKE